MSKIEFIADSVKVYGPKTDGGYTVTLGVGEYEQNKLAGLFMIPQGKVLDVIIQEGKDDGQGYKETA